MVNMLHLLGCKCPVVTCLLVNQLRSYGRERDGLINIIQIFMRCDRIPHRLTVLINLIHFFEYDN